MAYGQNNAAAATYITNDSRDEPRPSTDLESLRNSLTGSADATQNFVARLADIVIKLRGSRPPSADGNANVSAVPNGILAEMRETVCRQQNLHVEMSNLLSDIENAI